MTKKRNAKTARPAGRGSVQGNPRTLPAFDPEMMAIYREAGLPIGFSEVGISTAAPADD